MRQGGQFVEALSKLLLTNEPIGVVLFSPSTVGMFLPGFEATSEFPDEAWRITATGSFSFDEGTGNVKVVMGIWQGDTPVASSPNDPRRLTHNHFSIDRSSDNTRYITQYQDSVWVEPPPIGTTQAFSIYIDFVTATGTSQMRTYNTLQFALERFRKGPWHKNTQIRAGLVLVPPG